MMRILNPLSVMLDPLYQAAIAVDDVDDYVKRLEHKVGIKLEDVKSAGPGSIDKLTGLIKTAIERIGEVKKHHLSTSQENKLKQFVSDLIKIISRSGLKIEAKGLI